MSDLHEIFHDNTSERHKKIDKLRTKLDKLVEEGLWEPCDVLPDVEYNDEELSSKDCLLYYLCGYVTFQILKNKKCTACIDFLKAGNSNHPAAELVNLKSKGRLNFPNTYLYDFLSTVEDSFVKHCRNFNVFELVIEEITESNFNF